MTNWAILIGVDDHFEPRPACRNDVELTYAFLQEKYGFESQHMLKMLVNPPSVCNTTVLGLVGEDTIPTYENILKAFSVLQTHSRAGDLVYMHFSGGWCVVPCILPGYSSLPHHYSDIALLPALNPEAQSRPSYLRDVEVSAILHRLIQKGVEVTGVLDCRDARPIYDSPLLLENQIQFATTSSLIPMRKLMEMSVADSKRPRFSEGDMLESWIFDPDPGVDFTMLRSWEARPDGSNYRVTNDEVKDAQGLKHGCLTHWVHKALQNQDGCIGFKDLHRLLLREYVQTSALHPSAKLPAICLSGNTARMFPGGCHERRLAPISSSSQLPSHEQQRDQTGLEERPIDLSRLSTLSDASTGEAGINQDAIELSKLAAPIPGITIVS